MKTKICTKCGEEKELSKFSKYKNKNYPAILIRNMCRKCRAAEDYPGMKEYRQKNREKINTRQKEYYRKNREYCKTYDKKNVINLTDRYIASSILRMPLKELQQYPELIKLKRLHIQIQRELKQK